MEKRTVDWDLLVEEVFKGEIQEFLASNTSHHDEKTHSSNISHSAQDCSSIDQANRWAEISKYSSQTSNSHVSQKLRLGRSSQ
jgi:hypothetical protein